MSIAKQLIREFWFPLLVAIGWSTFNIYAENSGSWSVTKVVNVFGATFFLTSWLTAQYFRVRKQTKVENDLLRIQASTSTMLSQLEQKTSDLVAHVTGGDSYCYLTLANLMPGSNSGIVTVIHQGKHVLYDVTARICDLQAVEAVRNNLTFQAINNTEIHRSFGNLTPGFAKGNDVWDLGASTRRDFNIFWAARNGGFVQLLRFRRVGDCWSYATKVERGEVVFEQVQGDYPRNADGGVDWQ
jgi:hypothetical protein